MVQALGLGSEGLGACGFKVCWFWNTSLVAFWPVAKTGFSLERSEIVNYFH